MVSGYVGQAEANIEWFTDSSGDTVDAINSAQWARVLMMLMGREYRRGDTHLTGGGSGSVKQRLRCHRPESLMINKASAPKVDGEIKVSFVNRLRVCGLWKRDPAVLMSAMSWLYALWQVMKN